jgi:hypothetical protein
MYYRARQTFRHPEYVHKWFEHYRQNLARRHIHICKWWGVNAFHLSYLWNIQKAIEYTHLEMEERQLDNISYRPLPAQDPTILPGCSEQISKFLPWPIGRYLIWSPLISIWYRLCLISQITLL